MSRVSVEIEELVKKDTRFMFQYEAVKESDMRVIIPASFEGSRAINVVLKFPLVKAKYQCNKVYALDKRVKDKMHLVRLKGKRPLLFGAYPAIFMEYADGEDLGKYGTERKRLSEDEALRAIIHVARGLHEIHKLSLKHRDIKPSNILRYGDTWVLSDTKMAEVTEESVSVHNSPLFWSQGFAKAYGDLGVYLYTVEEDIFQLGLAFHYALDGTGRWLRKICTDSAVQHLNKQTFPTFVLNTINGMTVSDRAKYFLRQLLDEGAHRYSSIDQFLEEVERKDVAVPEIREVLEIQELDPVVLERNPAYEQFVALCKEYEGVLDRAKDARTGPLKTTAPELIDRVVQLHSKFVPLANDKDVKRGSERDTLFDRLKEKYNIVQELDEEILFGISRMIEERNKAGKMFTKQEEKDLLIPLYMTMYLWGPTFSSPLLGGQRCTLEQTRAGNTHCHREKPWSVFVET